MQDITQGEDTLELEVLINDDETMDSGFADRVEDGIQSVIEGACVNTRETLMNSEYIWHIRHRGPVTYRRAFLQCFAYREAQVIVNTTLDQSDHINRFENIVHDT